VPVLFGKKGLAWGNGLLAVPHGAAGVPSKREKDQRAPAGFFRIGTLFGYGARAPGGVVNPYYQVTARDCWIDDPARADYNKHIVVDPDNPPPWYAKQRMRLGDFAYEFLLEIRHNSDPPVPGHGSAIFFHIRRGVSTPTHGCTTMARADLVRLLQALKPAMKPHYVLLPKAEYAARMQSWGLPPAP
jgi:L,D-peptidoglycan transpeptidase YkuD (ErfK/YbiS/YcfS/YnhG family)